MRSHLIRSPVVLVGAPRSGTTMLFNALSAHPDLWSLYRESDAIIEHFFPVAMESGRSDVVRSDQVDDYTAARMEQNFFDAVGKMGGSQVALSQASGNFLRTPIGRRFLSIPVLSRLRLSMVMSRVGRHRKQSPLRIVEKTPENCFRIELLERVFEEPLYIHLTREPRASIASILTGWRDSHEFRRFEFPSDFHIKGYTGRAWCFGLVPGWEDLKGSNLNEVCARQWLSYSQHARDDLAKVGSRSVRVAYEDLTRDPGPVLRRIAEWADLDHQPFERFVAGLPIVNTFSKPEPDRWRKVEREINGILPIVAEEAAALGYRLS